MPGDVLLTGFSDMPIARLMTLPLTTFPAAVHEELQVAGLHRPRRQRRRFARETRFGETLSIPPPDQHSRRDRERRRNGYFRRRHGTFRFCGERQVAAGDPPPDAKFPELHFSETSGTSGESNCKFNINFR